MIWTFIVTFAKDVTAFEMGCHFRLLQKTFPAAKKIHVISNKMTWHPRFDATTIFTEENLHLRLFLVDNMSCHLK